MENLSKYIDGRKGIIWIDRIQVPLSESWKHLKNEAIKVKKMDEDSQSWMVLIITWRWHTYSKEKMTVILPTSVIRVYLRKIVIEKIQFLVVKQFVFYFWSIFMKTPRAWSFLNYPFQSTFSNEKIISTCVEIITRQFNPRVTQIFLHKFATNNKQSHIIYQLN